MTHPLDTFERRQAVLRKRPMGTGLSAVREALDRCGSPQDAVPSILIGGTNGKGSTAAMVESVARRAGYRTGLFHSPALGPTHGHVLLGGLPADETRFAERFLRADGAGRLSWFEAVTAAAFLTFAEERVDLAVVEVGMGGRRDCTNAVREPRVSAIVTVAMDHAEHLGPTLEDVAREKSGIFRRGRPAFLGWVAPQVRETVSREAERIGARLVPVEERPFEVLETSSAGSRFRLAADLDEPPVTLETPLPGAHQARNAALAAHLARELAGDGFPDIDDSTVALGLAECRWPARLETIRGPGRTVILDVAHNPAASEALAEYLAHLETPVDLLFGAFHDKDAAAMIEALRPVVGTVRVTATDHPRARPAAELAEIWRRIAPEVPCRIVSLSDALRPSQKSRTPLCVTGSADLVGRVRRLLLG